MICIMCGHPGRWHQSQFLRDGVPLCDDHAVRWRDRFGYYDLTTHDTAQAGLRPPPLSGLRAAAGERSQPIG